jgi:hypothetical protein
MRESIRFAWGSSSLGDFVVAMSKNGIVAVEFSSMHSATEEALSIRFPDAEFRRSRDELADVTGLLARLIDDPTIHCELPIDAECSEAMSLVARSIFDLRAKTGERLAASFSMYWSNIAVTRYEAECVLQ